ncbi:peptidoglycan-binding protein [Streptomyces sp. NPDC088757]|uniref:peptidoglycan-binding domain-containing protein n=1 Tax=Streptomyces sp. NPDC088757 TaxID=3365889 RepID=UPI003804BE47
MRNRAAPTAAVTSVTREATGAEHQGDRVFGKVAGPDRDGTGARGQDIELFDATAPLPKVPPRAARSARPARRTRRARAAAPAWRSMPLPLMLAGALSAGLGAAVAVWLSAEPDSVPASHPSVSLPDLVTSVPPPTRGAASDAPPSPGTSTARTTPSTPSPTPPSASGTPTPGTTPASATASPTATTVPAPTSSPSHRHRPPHSGRDEGGRDEGARDEDRRGEGGRGEGRRGEIGRGSTGPEIVDLQRRLRQLQLYLGPADGIFGESVEAALRRYQVARNIPQENGVYGPLTRAVLRAETG